MRYLGTCPYGVASLDGLEADRNAIRDELGWQEVEEQLKGQDVDVNRRLMLDAAKKETGAKVTDLVRQAYCIVVSVSAKNEVQAFKVVVGSDPLFTAIKADSHPGNGGQRGSATSWRSL